MRALSKEAMAADRDRLLFKFFRLVEGEAEGRSAISALVALVLAVLIVSLILKEAFLGQSLGKIGRSLSGSRSRSPCVSAGATFRKGYYRPANRFPRRANLPSRLKGSDGGERMHRL